MQFLKKKAVIIPIAIILFFVFMVNMPKVAGAIIMMGAIAEDGIKQGIIITTGNIRQNAWDYIVKLENNTDITIEIITFNNISF